MKHAGPNALDRLEPLLGELRKREALREKRRGCFYLSGRGFLHFHEHGEDELYADLGIGDDFGRLAATTAAQQRALLKRVDRLLKASRGSPSSR